MMKSVISRLSTAWFAGFVLLLCPLAGQAAECVSVSGHFNGKRASMERKVTFSGKTMTLTGKFGNQQAPKRTLDCVALSAGVLCERQFGPVTVTVMTNRKRMIETVTDPAGKEVAGFAYECEGSLRMR